jgi:hypothetical protein
MKILRISIILCAFSMILAGCGEPPARVEETGVVKDGAAGTVKKDAASGNELGEVSKASSE